MARQTQMNRNGKGQSAIRGVARSAAGLWHHLMTLAELQGRLFVIEVREALVGVRTPMALVAVSGVLAISAILLSPICLALALVELTGISPALAFAIVVLSSLLVSGGMLYAAFRRFRTAAALPRSWLEWRLNWNWLKSTLEKQSPAAGPSLRPLANWNATKTILH